MKTNFPAMVQKYGNSKKNILLFTLILLISLTGCMQKKKEIDNKASANAQETVTQENKSSTEEVKKEPYEIGSGSYSGTTGYKSEFSLNRDKGKYVNFWIKNTGNVNIKITINDSGERTFAPGESGHISAEVESASKNYTFKALPTPNGGNTSIDFRIVQRD